MMRLKPLIIGAIFITFAIPGYFYSPNLISQIIHSMMGSMPSSTPRTSSLLHQMGYPSREAVVKMIQYSFVGFAVTGIGFLFFGIIAKKKLPKQFTSKTITDNISEYQSQENTPPPNIHSIKILQERLAKGEITSSEFKNLKKLLD